MKPRKKIRLGDLLVENQIISKTQLDEALAYQRKSGRKLGQSLIDNGFIEESSLLQFLSWQLDIPYVNLKQYKFVPDVVRLIPEMQARRYRALALEERGEEVLVGMADPTDIFTYDELGRILKRPMRVAVVSESEMLRTFDRVYRRTDEISELAGELDVELSERDVDLGELTASDDVADAPVVKLIQSLFEDAVQVGASDIHIEPDEKVLRIRQRVDGVLQEQVMNEKRIAPALVLRLKLVAGLDISERRLPQDGRFSIKVKKHDVDVRISTMPVQFGESVVLRLLDQSGVMLRLDQLGLPGHVQARVKRAVSRPHGMVLVTGPTGSGKTTTLYAALSQLNAPDRKIITVEDPVEYRLERVNQVQVRPEIDLSFSRVLRSVLRQDPDVILVGEMRDGETVDIGLRAAMTGHLVLSTLHTNDAASTVTRLLDMGAEGYLVSSALHMVVAQRLVRRVCGSCAQPHVPGPAERAWVTSALGVEHFPDTLRRGAGCPHCQDTGFRGRAGVFEVLEIDEPLQEALARDDAAEFATRARQRLRGQTLLDAAYAEAVAGRTSLSEVVRLDGGSLDMADEPETGAQVRPTAVHDATAGPALIAGAGG